MGKPVRLSQVEVLFGSGVTTRGIYLGDNNTISTTRFATSRMVASRHKRSGSTTSTPSAAATGRYVLIWLTSPSRRHSGAPTGKFMAASTR